MTEWSEADSAVYRDLADIAVPRRQEMLDTVVAVVPFSPEEALSIVEIGCGDGSLATRLLERFPRARLLALDGSESMRAAAHERLAASAHRVAIRSFRLEGLDWWDRLTGADVVVSSLCLHHLNDAKKR